jgi:methylmalonyl-CoA mutase N-terminal domain/subunit
LKKLYQSAKGNGNMMPHVIDAIMAYATIGEIVGTVRVAHGNTFDPSETLSPPFPFE